MAVGTGLVKCSRCTIRQVQDAFPRARNLEFLKTCDTCTLKLSHSRQKARNEHSPDEESSSSTLLRKGPKPRAAELHTQLGWEEFLGLVGSHKSVAFELDAEIKLVGEGALDTEPERTAADLDMIDNVAGDDMSDCLNDESNDDPYATRVSNFQQPYSATRRTKELTY